MYRNITVTLANSCQPGSQIAKNQGQPAGTMQMGATGTMDIGKARFSIGTLLA